MKYTQGFKPGGHIPGRITLASHSARPGDEMAKVIVQAPEDSTST